MQTLKFKRVWTGSMLGTCQNMRKHYEYHSEDGQYIISQGRGCMDWDKPYWRVKNTVTKQFGSKCSYLADAKNMAATV